MTDLDLHLCDTDSGRSLCGIKKPIPVCSVRFVHYGDRARRLCSQCAESAGLPVPVPVSPDQLELFEAI